MNKDLNKLMRSYQFKLVRTTKHGSSRHELTEYSQNWLEKYIQVWDIIQQEEVNSNV